MPRFGMIFATFSILACNIPTHNPFFPIFVHRVSHFKNLIQDIDTMMSSWTKHMGFPLVTVSQTIEPDRRILKLHQSRFMLDGGKDEGIKNLHFRRALNSVGKGNLGYYGFSMLSTN